MQDKGEQALILETSYKVSCDHLFQDRCQPLSMLRSTFSTCKILIQGFKDQLLRLNSLPFKYLSKIATSNKCRLIHSQLNSKIKMKISLSQKSQSLQSLSK